MPAILGVVMPFAASAAQEGLPSYYQSGARPTQSTQTINNSQILGQRNYSYQVPRATVAQQQYGQVPGSAAPTPYGIGLPTQPDWQISATYGRKYADFEFETGVNSILKWNDMIIDEVGVRLDHNFNMRDYNLFVFGEYRYGSVSSGGLSMDYDLKPYNTAQPSVGIFTISMGDMAGKTDYVRFGFGAKNIWDMGGWKLSPVIGYEIFKHNLEMSNHIYPNPGIYLPLMTDKGDYVFGDQFGNYYNVPTNGTPADNLYQVCLSPEDIKVVLTGANGLPAFNPDGTLVTIPYDPLWGNIPWGVGPNDCVIIGGDGVVLVPGVTHIYNTTWQGVYLGLEVEKQMTFADKLRFYVQVGMPNYYSEGIWPNRTDWQQRPSFIDEGSNGAYSYQAEMEYIYQMSSGIQLSLKATTDFFYVGRIGGELYVAGYTTYLYDESTGQYVTDDLGIPILVEVPAHTERINDSLKHAKWQSFGLHLGLKYAF